MRLPFFATLYCMADQPILADRVLSSWKEIATYLRVSVRTAQSWQERGLPVQRIPGGRARVTVRVAALERWRASGNGGSMLAEEAITIAPRRQVLWFSRRALFLAGVVVFCSALALVADRLFLRKAVPFSVRFEHHAVVVVDAGGRELWRKPFDLVDPTRAGASAPIAWFGDLDGDGRTEVLFVPPLPMEYGDQLLCYEQDGRERWRFTPGGRVATTTETFTPNFRVAHLLVGRFGRDPKVRILVTSGHNMYYPAQVALLTANGHRQREYWHAGHLNRMLAMPLGTRGEDQFVLAGISNARHAATLIVLDPDRFAGAAVEDDPKYKFVGLGQGIEEARLLFPRSCMNRMLEPYNAAAELSRQQDGIIVTVRELYNSEPPMLYYHLATDLRLRQLGTSSTFEREHARLHATSELDHAFTAAEADALHHILYLHNDVSAIHNAAVH